MKQIVRPALSAVISAYLTKRRAKLLLVINGGLPFAVDDHWKPARKTKSLAAALKLLQNAAGAGHPCMYCVHNIATDIEHFWPKAVYPTKTFEWANFLAACTECGRIKGSQFPLAAGVPLMIDPTVDNPWDYLDFDPDTGNLTAKFDVLTQAPSARGVETVRVLRLDKREALSSLYSASYKRIVAVVYRSLHAGVTSGANLASELAAADSHGLLVWCFSDRGLVCEPFKTLKSDYAVEFDNCINAGLW